MFPGSNNPFPPNMMGPPFGLNQPPPMVPPGIIPQMTMPVAPRGVPQNMQVPPSILPGQPPIYQSQAPLSQPRQAFPNLSVPTQRFPVQTQPTTALSTNQGKDKVTKMTVDFIKQFQEQVAKKKVVEERNNRMKVQSKASAQGQTLGGDREGSPFSDVSDTDLPVGASKKGGAEPLKGILRNRAGGQHSAAQIHTSTRSSNIAQSSVLSVTSSYSQKTTSATSSAKPQTTSTGLNAIVKNYQSESTSSTSKTRQSNTGQGSADGGKFIPTLTRRDSRGDRKKDTRRDSEKNEALQDISDDEDDLDSDHVQSQVFIGNLPFNVTEAEILSYLAKYRVEVWVGQHKREKDKVCAFVKTPSMKDARTLISGIKHDRYKGCNLLVRLTAASDFTRYKVLEPTRGRPPDPGPDKSYDCTAVQQQMYYTQVPQYLPNPGDTYSVPVYLVPPSLQPTQQLFIPTGAYPIDIQAPPPQYDSRDYDTGDYGSPSMDSRSRDYSPVPERKPRKFTVYIGNLPINLSMASLEAYLTRQNHCGINLKSRDGQAYAFVDFHEYEDARNMVRDMDNKNCYGRNIHVRMADDDELRHLDGQTVQNWRDREREVERERQSKSLFQGYVDSAFANAPLLGKKYITEYLSVKEMRAVYVCSVCMEMSYGSEVAEHIVGYRHRLKCFRKDQPDIYDKMCRIREKSKMMMECARMAADYEILSEKITVQVCMDPEERAKKHLENIKDASFIGSRKSKTAESSKEKESSSSSSSSAGMDIFKRIAMHKKKLEETKKDEKKKETEDNPKKMTFETLSNKNKSLADTIVAEIASRQKEEDNVNVDAKTKEMERKKEEEKQKKLKETKQREEDMKKRLEEARLKVIENQRKIEEDRKRKEEEERKRKEDEKRAEEDRLRKIEEEKIMEEKRILAEQKRKLEEEKRQLEQQKLQEAKRRALEQVKKKEEEMKRKEIEKREEEKLRKEAEERQKVELMLRMLEDEKKLEEEARKFEEEKKIKEIQMLELQRRELEEKRQAELKKLEEYENAERLKREKIEQEKKEAEAVIKRQKQLEVLNDLELNRRKAMLATQRRMAALKRVDDMQKAKGREGNVGVSKEFPVIYDQHYYDKHEANLNLEQKLVQSKRKAYVSLPFSMDEKRMDLKTNIGPDEKIGPDPNSKFDAVLAMKFNLKSEQCPLIGLQYIVEGYEGISNTNHKYFCELCCVETINCDGILQHLIGFVHRRKYLEIHKAEEYAMLMQQDLRRGTLNELTKQKAILIEQESGRHQIPTLSMYEFKAFVQKMKDVENAFRGLVPKVSGEAIKMKEMVEMSEKDDMTQTDHSQYDPTINVQTILNSTLAAACEVTIEEGRTWVELYKYLDQMKINKDTLLGLQYVTEIRGNKRYAPKYTCNLCDIKAVKWPEYIFNHLQSKDHLLKLLNLMHPEKIIGNPRLERKLSDAERTKIIQEIALEVAAARKQIESLKVGVLLVENVWRTWHEKDQEDNSVSQEDIEFEEELKQEVTNLKPQLYDMIRHIQLPICGLQYITEIQNDNRPTVYRCSCCKSMEISRKSIIGHLRGRPHRKAFIRKTKPPNWGTIIRTDVDGYLKSRPKSADESITVKKVLYLNNQGITVYTEPVVLPDPRLVGLINQAAQYRLQNQKKAQDKPAQSKPAVTTQQTTAANGPKYPKPTTDKPAAPQPTVTEAQKPSTITSQPTQPNGPMYSKVTPAKTTSVQPTVTEKQKSTSTSTVTSQTVQAKQTVVSEPVKSDHSDKSTPEVQRPPTRFDKIVKGLDYTPLLGIEFLTEVQDEKGVETPRFECDLCNMKGALTVLTTKNILRHIGTKGHRMTYFERKHPEIFQAIKCRVGWEKKNVKLDRYTKEIGSKCREQINIRIEKDPLFWNGGKQQNNTEIKDDDDEVTIVKVETKAKTPSKEETKLKESTVTKSPEIETAPPSPLDLDQIVNESNENTKKWNEDNEKIKEKIQSGMLIASSKSSKFVADYNATFCSYPIIGLQWITEFHKEDTGNWWGVCRLCEERIDNWRFLSNHMSCLKHRLKYIQKKYPQIYATLKRENLTSLNMLKQKVYKHSQDIMKKEAKEFKPEVMLQKYDPNEKTPEPSPERKTSKDCAPPWLPKQYFIYKIKTTEADTKTKTTVANTKAKATVAVSKSRTTVTSPKGKTPVPVQQVKKTVDSNVRSIPTLGTSVRHSPMVKVRHPSHSANIIELTPDYRDQPPVLSAVTEDKRDNKAQTSSSDGKPKSTPQKRSSTTSDESNQTRKKQKLESENTKIRKDSKDSKETKTDKQDDTVKKQDTEVIDLEISSEDVRETLQMKRVEEKPELKNLKRKAQEETDIKTKTLDLKRGMEDSDDEDVKMKKSKTDHKSRSYRDSYGTSYGVDRDKQSGSRSRQSKSGDSRRRRSRSRSRPRHGSSRKDSRDRGRSERDRNTKSKHRNDGDKSRTSKQREKGKEEAKTKSDNKDKIKEKETVEERGEVEDNESGGENDFDAFIMAQLGEGFVTVDEVEGGEEDFMTLDEVGDDICNENSNEGDVEMNDGVSHDIDSENDKEASVAMGALISDKDSVVNEDTDKKTEEVCHGHSESKVEKDESDLQKSEDKYTNIISKGDKEGQDSQQNEENDSKVVSTSIRGRERKQKYAKSVDGELEVSVEIGEQKSSEKSDITPEKDETSATSSRMKLSSINIQVEPEPVSSDVIKNPENDKKSKQQDMSEAETGTKTEPEVSKSETSDTTNKTEESREPDRPKEANKTVSRQPRRRNSNTASIVVEIGHNLEKDSNSAGIELATAVGTVEIEGPVEEEKKATGKKAGVKKTVKQKTSKVEAVETVNSKTNTKSSKTNDQSNDKSNDNGKGTPDKSEQETAISEIIEAEGRSSNVTISPGSAKAKTASKARQGKSPAAAKKVPQSPASRQTRFTRNSKFTFMTMEIDDAQKSPVKTDSKKDNKSGKKRKNEVEVSIEIG